MTKETLEKLMLAIVDFRTAESDALRAKEERAIADRLEHDAHDRMDAATKALDAILADSRTPTPIEAIQEAAMAKDLLQKLVNALPFRLMNGNLAVDLLDGGFDYVRQPSSPRSVRAALEAAEHRIGKALQAAKAFLGQP